SKEQCKSSYTDSNFIKFTSQLIQNNGSICQTSIVRYRA
ncbi:uncharacterized protein METZ01_LOCUS352563, partial [marine metagenome]